MAKMAEAAQAMRMPLGSERPEPFPEGTSLSFCTNIERASARLLSLASQGHEADTQEQQQTMSVFCLPIQWKILAAVEVGFSKSVCSPLNEERPIGFAKAEQGLLSLVSQIQFGRARASTASSRHFCG